MFHDLSLASAKMCVCEYVMLVGLNYAPEREGGPCLGISPIDLRACVIYVSWSFLYIYICDYVCWVKLRAREGGWVLPGGLGRGGYFWC